MDEADHDERQRQALELVHRQEVDGVVGQDCLTGGLGHEGRGELARHVGLDLASQPRDRPRAGQVVADDDVGAGRVEVHELVELPALEEQEILRDRILALRDHLERRIAAVDLPVHLSDVVGHGDGLVDHARGVEEVLKGRHPAEHVGILDPALPPRVDDDVEVQGAAQRPVEVLDPLADKRVLREEAHEVGVDAEPRPAHHGHRHRQPCQGQDVDAVPKVEVAEPGQEREQTLRRRVVQGRAPEAPGDGPEPEEERQEQHRHDPVREDRHRRGLPELDQHGDVGEDQAPEPDHGGRGGDGERQGRLLEHAADRRELRDLLLEAAVVARDHVHVLGEADRQEYGGDDRRQHGQRKPRHGHEPQRPHDAEEASGQGDDHALRRAKHQKERHDQHGHAEGNDRGLVGGEVFRVGHPGDDAPDLIDGDAWSCLAPDELLDLIGEPPIELGVPRPRVRIDADRGGVAVSGDDVADENPIAEGVAAKAGDRLRVARHGVAHERFGVEGVSLASDVAHRREADDPGGPLEALESIGEPLDRLENARCEHIIGLDHHRGEVVAAEPPLRLLVELARRIPRHHEPLGGRIPLEPRELAREDQREPQQEQNGEPRVVEEPEGKALHAARRFTCSFPGPRVASDHDFRG